MGGRRLQDGGRAGKLAAEASVPAVTFPVGEEEEKICGWDVGIRRCLDAVLWRLSIRCAFHKRERSPQQISFFRSPHPHPPPPGTEDFPIIKSPGTRTHAPSAAA